jgi:hypothetical protein
MKRLPALLSIAASARAVILTRSGTADAFLDSEDDEAVGNAGSLSAVPPVTGNPHSFPVLTTATNACPLEDDGEIASARHGALFKFDGGQPLGQGESGGVYALHPTEAASAQQSTRHHDETKASHADELVVKLSNASGTTQIAEEAALLSKMGHYTDLRKHHMIGFVGTLGPVDGDGGLYELSWTDDGEVYEIKTGFENWDCASQPCANFVMPRLQGGTMDALLAELGIEDEEKKVCSYDSGEGEFNAEDE